MAGVTQESVVEDITALLSETDERIRMIEELENVLQKELLRTHIDVPDMACPFRWMHGVHPLRQDQGRHTEMAMQRMRVCSLPVDTGSILANTKLDYSVWMEHAVCFVDGLTSDKVAKRIHVCHKTAWFMRLRTMQRRYSHSFHRSR